MEESIQKNILNNQTINNQPVKKLNLLLVFGFLILMITTSLLFFMNKRSSDKKKKDIISTKISPKINNSVKPTQVVNQQLTKKTNGSFSLMINQTNIKIGQPFNLIIIGDSGQEEVITIDILIKYDKNKLKFLSAKSNLKDLSIYSDVLDNHLNLTLIKNLNAKTPIYLSQSPLINIVFEPLVKGDIEIELINSYENRETFFVNEKNEKFFPHLEKKQIIVVN